MRLRALVILAALVAATTARADDLTPRQLAFLEEHEDASLVILSDSNEMQVEHRMDPPGIHMDWVHDVEYVVLDRNGIEMVNRQPVFLDPVRDCRKFRVEIEHAAGGSSDFDRDDLEWVEFDTNSEGVYTFDQLGLYAVIPRIAVGDRVRVRSEYRLEGAHGLLPLAYAMWPGVPVLDANLEVEYPNDQPLIHEWLADAETLERIEEETEQKRKTSIYRAHLEDVSPRRREAWAYGEVERGIRWIGQLTDGPGLGESFALGPDWQTAGQVYLDQITDMLEPTDEIREEALAVIAESGSVSESISLLYEHVQRECRYLGLFEGLGGLIPEPAPSTLDRRYGDCKGLSLLLITMLRAVEIDAWPALVCAGDAGPFSERIPNMAQFNHFIVWADDQQGGVWLDPVYDFCPSGLVPGANARQPLLLMKPGEVGLVAVDASASPAGAYTRTVSGSFLSDGTANFELEEVATGNAALYRRLWLLDENDPASALRDRLFSGGPANAAVQIRFEDKSAWDQPWKARLDVGSCRVATVADGQLYIPLSVISMRMPRLDASSRRTDLHMQQWPSESLVWDFELPAAFSLDEISESREAPGMRWSLSARVEANRLLLERSIEFEPGVLDASRALELAQALEEIRSLENIYLELTPVDR